MSRLVWVEDGSEYVEGFHGMHPSGYAEECGTYRYGVGLVEATGERGNRLGSYPTLLEAQLAVEESLLGPIPDAPPYEHTPGSPQVVDCGTIPPTVVCVAGEAIEKGEAVYRVVPKVDHPPHYGGDTVYEVIKVIEAWNLGFVLGNVVKYVARAGKKTNHPLEDLKKARWYIDREISRMETTS